MRFMIMLMSKSAREAVRSVQVAAGMMQYTMPLQRAGVLLAQDGLFAPSTGARISYTDGKAKVTDGPFAEAEEWIRGFWIVQVRSREEAIEWAKRAPVADDEAIEVRQIHEMPSFQEQVREVTERFETPESNRHGRCP